MPPAASAAAAPRSSRVLLELYRTFGPHLRPYWRWFAVGYTAMAGAVFLKTLAPSRFPTSGLHCKRHSVARPPKEMDERPGRTVR